MSAAFPSRRRKSTWRETVEAEATFWRVTCGICGFTEVKASKRNVELFKVGHMGSRHFGVAWNFSVVPLKREEAGQ